MMKNCSVCVTFFVRYICFQVGMHFLFNSNQVCVTLLLQKIPLNSVYK